MDADASAPEQCATAAVVLGLVSLVVCWWFPFGALLGATGTALGIGAWYAGRVAERALVGAFLAASGTGAALLLAWDYWRRVFGA
jgi:hypothetical protein